MNEIIKALHERRSVRKYTDKAVPRELVEEVVKAGLAAASARNTQPWHLSVVLDRAKIDALTSELKAAVARMPENPYKAFVGASAYTVNYHAPVFIIVSGDPAESGMVLADCALVMANMALAAHSLGLGSCWINQLGSACAEPGFRAVLTGFGVPEGNPVYACLCLGYAVGPLPAAPERKPGKVNYVE